MGPLTALLGQLAGQGGGGAGGKGGADMGTALLAAQALQSPKASDDPEIKGALREIAQQARASSQKSQTEDTAKLTRDELRSAISPEFAELRTKLANIESQGERNRAIQAEARRAAWERRVISRLDALMEAQGAGAQTRRY
jgi:hypothetical protein